MKIEVYSDGSATVASKPGGYGWVIVADGVKYSEGSGNMASATNNDAELEAAIQGLTAAFSFVNKHVVNPLPYIPVDVTLVSDSEIVLGWVNGTYRFKQTAKMDKYNQLMKLVRGLHVKTRWVEGHTGDEHNERCDELANLARKSYLEGQARELLDKLSTNTISLLPVTKIGTKKESVISIWHKDKLKVIDLSQNIVEDWDIALHGPRDSRLGVV